MKRLVIFALLLAGCGASYSITRTTPDGATLNAQAWTSESSDSVKFTFQGNLQTGVVTGLTLEKLGAQPVNMTAQTLEALLKTAPAASGFVQ